MFDSAVVDVAFGLIFVFVILSLACSALNATISSIFNWRAEFLRQGIANLLEPANLDRGLEHTGKLLEHPLLNALVRPTGQRSKRRRYPSYVPSRTFVAALLDFDRAGAGRNVEEAIAAVPSEDARRALAVLYERADGDVTRFTRDAGALVRRLDGARLRLVQAAGAEDALGARARARRLAERRQPQDRGAALDAEGRASGGRGPSGGSPAGGRLVERPRDRP